VLYIDSNLHLFQFYNN